MMLRFIYGEARVCCATLAYPCDLTDGMARDALHMQNILLRKFFHFRTCIAFAWLMARSGNFRMEYFARKIFLTGKKFSKEYIYVDNIAATRKA